MDKCVNCGSMSQVDTYIILNTNLGRWCQPCRQAGDKVAGCIALNKRVTVEACASK